jgi:hypothetical protein
VSIHRWSSGLAKRGPESMNTAGNASRASWSWIPGSHAFALRASARAPE